MQVVVGLFLLFLAAAIFREFIRAVGAVLEFFSIVINFIFVDYIFLTLIFIALAFLYVIKKRRDGENKRKIALQAARAEQERLERLRDSDHQSEPYTYEIGKHANQTLAIRYGIANTTLETIPYYYYAKGGIKKRNYDRDRKRVVNSDTIKLRKIKRLSGNNQFLGELSGFKKRKAVAIHIAGEEFIRTFYPINATSDDVDHDWWQRNPELEAALKDNKTFTLKEMAKFHVEKTVPVRIK